MASIYLDVPFVTQLGIGGVRDDPLGCWYAAACMVAYYFEAGPRLGIPAKFNREFTASDGSKYIGHSAASFDDYKTLMKNEHLENVDKPDGKIWSGDLLAALLRMYGPLSFGWIKTSASSGKSYGHRSVLIGYQEKDTQVIFHDPENAPRQRMKLADWNTSFNWPNPYAMLRRAGVPFQVLKLESD